MQNDILDKYDYSLDLTKNVLTLQIIVQIFQSAVNILLISRYRFSQIIILMGIMMMRYLNSPN